MTIKHHEASKQQEKKRQKQRKEKKRGKRKKERKKETEKAKRQAKAENNEAKRAKAHRPRRYVHFIPFVGRGNREVQDCQDVLRCTPQVGVV